MNVTETAEKSADVAVELPAEENAGGAGTPTDSEPDDARGTFDDASGGGDGDETAKVKREIPWSRVLVSGVLPGLALSLAVGAGFLKWQDSSTRVLQIARVESVAAAEDSTIAMLSYHADTAEKELNEARSRLTGEFAESYTQLINDVVIPGSKRQHISTTATVPAGASVSATTNHAVALLFVNQTAIVNDSPPQETVSSVRVTLEKFDGRWLISGFEPV